jgi:excinuclease ABC subunit C
VKKSDLKTLELPDTPGVYFFRHGTTILYIGKATSLADRVCSYFASDIGESRGPKIVKMLELADNITWQQTDSVLEALILESRLIKQHQPEYNTREKDNKSFNYIVITDEAWPRVMSVRQHDLDRGQTGKLRNVKVDEVYGPFTSGNQLREALKILRKIFPFRDDKSRQQTHERFYKQLGLTPDTSDSSAARRYQTSIKNLKMFLSGEKDALVTKLEREMKSAAKKLEFEYADQIKKTLFALQHIRDISLIKDIHTSNNASRAYRVEAYDIAHMSGQNTVGVMTVVTNSEADTSQYRKFKIKSDTKGSDTDALRELLERRFAHDEWLMPNLVVIDGGLAQKRVAESVFRQAGIEIPVVSVVKNERHQPKNILGQRRYIENYEAEILLANYEAHRFAINYHKDLRRKKSLGK